MWGQILGGLAGGIAGGGLGLFGSAAATSAEIHSAEHTNEKNRAMVREQMKFQERMSSTAHQRQAKDLEKAGLNRILGISTGGSSTPGGASVAVQNPMEGVSNTAQSLSRLVADIQNIRANTKLANTRQQEASWNAKSAQAAAFTATNVMKAEKKFPKGYGQIDAILKRLSPAGAAASKFQKTQRMRN